MKKNLDMIRGDTLAFAVKITFDSDVQELDSAYFTCKRNYAEDTPIFQKKLNNGIYVSEETDDGLIYIVRVAPKDTKDIDAGKYYYDLEIGVNSDVFTILYGVLDIENDVTYGNENAVGYQSKTVTPTGTQQIITADAGYIALSEVIVSAVPDGNEVSY